MFDVAPSELLVCAVVALVVIGPKDLPKAMRVVGHWVSRARAVGRQFRSGIDTMMRESELQDMERKWAQENDQIMREHPAVPAADLTAMTPLAADHPAVPDHSVAGDKPGQVSANGAGPSDDRPDNPPQEREP